MTGVLGYVICTTQIKYLIGNATNAVWTQKTCLFRPAFIREQGAKFAALGEERERDEKDEFVIKNARENQVTVRPGLTVLKQPMLLGVKKVLQQGLNSQGLSYHTTL